MNLIPRWNRDDHSIYRLKNELDNAFQRFFDDPNVSSSSFWNRNSRFVPVLDVEEKSDRYTVEAEVPGLDSDDIDIDVEDNVLTIKGERKGEDGTKNRERKMYLAERRYGSFQRFITLPENADPNGITAEIHKGVLYIDIPKKKKTKPRRIDINHRDNH